MEIFDHFLLKILDLGPVWSDKNDFTIFFVFAKIFTKKRVSDCPRNQQLRWHSFSVVDNYADTM